MCTYIRMFTKLYLIWVTFGYLYVMLFSTFCALVMAILSMHILHLVFEIDNLKILFIRACINIQNVYIEVNKLGKIIPMLFAIIRSFLFIFISLKSSSQNEFVSKDHYL